MGFNQHACGFSPDLSPEVLALDALSARQRTRTPKRPTACVYSARIDRDCERTLNRAAHQRARRIRKARRAALDRLKMECRALSLDPDTLDMAQALSRALDLLDLSPATLY